MATKNLSENNASEDDISGFVEEEKCKVSDALAANEMQSESGESQHFNERHINFAKVLVFLREAGGDILNIVMNQMYKSKYMETNQGQLHIFDYLVQKRNKTQNAIRKECQSIQFSYMYDSAKKQMVKGWNEKKDISYNCYLITEVCKPVYSQLSNEGQEAITGIKVLRNEMSHDNLTKMDTNDFKKYMDILGEHFKTAINAATELLEIDMKDKLNQVDEHYLDLLNNKLPNYDYKLHYNEFMKELQTKVIKNSRSKLTEYYNSHTQFFGVDPILWVGEGEERKDVKKLKLSEIYFPLDIKYQHRNIVLDEKFLYNSIKSRCVIVRGTAGSGKTTLCRYILHRYINESKFSKYNLVIYMEICDILYKNILDYFKKELFYQTFSEKFEDVENILRNLNILFIIDGYDEKNKYTNDLLKSMFSLFLNSTCIITVRPEFSRDLYGLLARKRDHESVEVYGFNKENVNSYCESALVCILGENKGKAENRDLQNYIREKNCVLGSYLALPLILVMLVILWIHDKDHLSDITTSFQLYRKIFDLWLCRAALRMEAGQYVTEYEHTLKIFLSHLQEYSFDCILKDKDILCFNELNDMLSKEKFFDNKIKSDKLIDALSHFIVKIDLKKSNTPTTFSFCHQSMFEYFAGTHLGKVLLNYAEIDKNIYKMFRTPNIIKYCVGYLNSMKKLTEKFCLDLLQHSECDMNNNYDYMWLFLKECCKCDEGELEFNQNMVFSITNALNKADKMILDSCNVVSGLNLLINTDTVVKNLVIKFDSDYPEEVSGFKDLFLEMRKSKMLNRYNRQNPLHTELHFLHQYEIGNTLADEFIYALHPWAHLIKLTAHIGESAARFSLGYCKNLTSLRCRISSICALRWLSKNLRDKRKLKKLFLTLDLDKSATIDDVALCISNCDVELTLSEFVKDNFKWIVQVVSKLSPRQGFWRICIKNTEFDEKVCSALVLEIGDYVRDKLTIESFCDVNEEAIGYIRKKCYFTLDWISR